MSGIPELIWNFPGKLRSERSNSKSINVRIPSMLGCGDGFLSWNLTTQDLFWRVWESKHVELFGTEWTSGFGGNLEQ